MQTRGVRLRLASDRPGRLQTPHHREDTGLDRVPVAIPRGRPPADPARSVGVAADGRSIAADPPPRRGDMVETARNPGTPTRFGDLEFDHVYRAEESEGLKTLQTVAKRGLETLASPANPATKEMQWRGTTCPIWAYVIIQFEGGVKWLAILSRGPAWPVLAACQDCPSSRHPDHEQLLRMTTMERCGDGSRLLRNSLVLAPVPGALGFDGEAFSRPARVRS
jgi:hypothetical protein